MLYSAAWAIGSSGNSQHEYGLPYELSFAIPAALLVASFAIWDGPWQVHLWQLVIWPALFLAWFIGVMAITGDWL
jgi:hypothetical protein